MVEPEGKPFHESIVEAIHDCHDSDLICLSNLIKNTRIPANHDAIVTAWLKRIKTINPNEDFGVPKSVLGKKPMDYKKIMNDAPSLEKALELGFDYLPLGTSFLGPQKKILLIRSDVPKGHKDVAEILVIDAVVDTNRTIFSADWGENAKAYSLRVPRKNKIEDWSNKW